MKEIVVSARESGQRLDKYLKKYLSEAGAGFIYKMLRKKNIVLNESKASGRELLNEGDVIRLYLADDTIAGFTGKSCAKDGKHDVKLSILNGKRIIECCSYNVEIIYEDDDVIFFNKPAGLLSQKAAEDDISLVDILNGYMRLTAGDIGGASGYNPGICNRLDRNTSGIVAAGKSIKGLQALSGAIKERRIRKIYHCIVCGHVEQGDRLKGYLVKDKRTNKVSITKNDKECKDTKGNYGGQYIETVYRPVGTCALGTILEVELITGKTHQIRAHLAGIGHPVAGDVKYGAPRTRQIRHHLLHAYEMRFGIENGALKGVSGQRIIAGYPEVFEKAVSSGRKDSLRH